MIIACIQTEPDFGNVETNLRDAVPLIEEADADLCVLPELFATGYAFESRSEAYDLSEYIPGGPTTSRLTECARASGSTIVAGVAERSGDQLFNSAVVITPSGWLGTYRKAHLFYEETGIFTPGDAFQVWTVTDRQRRSYRLGVMVCFDWLFPESARTLALRGADVIAHPSNLVLPHCPSAMPMRALENGVFTATANRIGTESNSRGVLNFIGQSIICSPGAETLQRAPEDQEAILRVEVDIRTARDKQLNEYNQRWSDRRRELYER